MNAAVLAGSVVAVLIVTALVRLLGLGRGAALDEAAALQAAADACTGHRFVTAAVDRDGRAALVEDAAGEIALVRAHGDKWVVRLLARPAAVRHDGEALIVPPSETMFGATTLTLAADEAARWAAKLQRARDA